MSRFAFILLGLLPFVPLLATPAVASPTAQPVASRPPGPELPKAPASDPGSGPLRPTAELPPAEANLGTPLLHTTGLLFGMRLTEAILWPEPFAETEPKIWLRHYERTFTKPPLFDPDANAFEWDHDHFALNLVGHGLLGSELYYRPRRCGHVPLAAFIFATGASTTWEYVFEGNGVRPSALDLVYTPLAGIALGELRFWGVTLSREIRDPFLRGFVRALLDPFGEVERELGAPC